MPRLADAVAALPPPVPARRMLGIAALFVAAYVYLDWVSYIYPIVPFAITPWNPPAGLGLALLLVFGLRMWPALAVAAALSDWTVRGPSPLPHLDLLATAVPVAGYVAVAALLRGPLGFRTEFDRLRDVVALLVVVVVVSLFVAIGYVLVYRLAGMVKPQAFVPAVMRLWGGDLIGIVTTTPPLLLLAHWQKLRQTLLRRSWAEIAAQFASVVLVLLVIFALKWTDEYKLFYLLFVPLIWIAVRHGIVGATLAIMVIQVGLITAVELSDYRGARVLEFQFLMLALAISGLFLGIVIAERRAARDALRESESRLRAIVSTAPAGIITVDERGTVISANPAAARMFGFVPEALQGIAVRDVLPGFERVAHGGENAEVTAVRRDGARFPVELAIGSTGSEKPGLRIGIARDLTSRKEIERRLQEKQAALNRSIRLAAAGEMAAALAHELHQPLAAISNYARACQMLEHSSATAEVVDKVVREAVRAAEVVQRLRDFFRGGASRLEPVRLGRLVESALASVRERAARHGVTLTAAVGASDIELLIDRVQIETVIHSLVANAIDAISPMTGGERWVRVTTGDAGGGWVRVSVIDSGPGIDPLIADRLFEPFATTKPTGTGLGLALSRSLVEAHGGALWAESAASGGTVFHFTLLSAAAAEALGDDE